VAPVDPDPRTNDDQSLADTLRELANAPVADGRLGELRARSLASAERLTTRGTLGPLAELGWSADRRMKRVGGSALAALLAYRAFVWLLPFALVCVFVISLADPDVLDRKGATDRFGLVGYVAAEISVATQDTGGPGLITGAVIGGLVLLYATFALVRSLRAVHALIWAMPPGKVSRPARATLVALGLLTVAVLGRGLIDGAAEGLGGITGSLVMIASWLVGPAIWLLASWWLPHRARSVRELVPGTAFLFVTLSLVHAFIALVLYPYLRGKEETYGGLGIAAGIMFALFVIGWAISAAAAINAQLAAVNEAAAQARRRRRLSG
jgi:uncharacterized BrkB/YihY/UPF0761 family membrane protein